MLAVEHELGRRVDRIDAVLLVGEAPQHEAPFAFALFQEVVEAAGADHVALNALDLGALR